MVCTRVFSLYTALGNMCVGWSRHVCSFQCYPVSLFRIRSSISLFCVCTISPLSPPKSVFSIAEIHHLWSGASPSNENAPDYKWRTWTSEKTEFGGERGEIVQTQNETVEDSLTFFLKEPSGTKRKCIECQSLSQRFSVVHRLCSWDAFCLICRCCPSDYETKKHCIWGSAGGCRKPVQHEASRCYIAGSEFAEHSNSKRLREHPSGKIDAYLASCSYAQRVVKV